MMNRDLESLAGSLRNLPRKAPPNELSDRLRVMASRESLRRRRRASVGSLLRWWAESAGLFVNNLMKPVAVPFAGGLISALILFAVLAPGLAIQRPVRDVPSPIATEPAVQAFFALPESDEDMVVDVWVDGQGRVIDYSIPQGQTWASDPALVRNVENTLLCTKFAPATRFGQPASGKIRIMFRCSQLEVRG
jgi:hypothetical protein